MQLHVVVILLVALANLWPSIESQVPEVGQRTKQWGPSSLRQVRDYSDRKKNDFWSGRVVPARKRGPPRNLTAVVIPPAPSGTVLRTHIKGVKTSLLCGRLSPNDFKNGKNQQYRWEVTIHRMYKPKPKVYTITLETMQRQASLIRLFALNATTFELEIMKPLGNVIDAVCKSRTRVEYKEHGRYRLILEMPPPTTTQPLPEITTTTEPPTEVPFRTTLTPDPFLPPPTEAAPSDLVAFLTDEDTQQVQVKEFSNKVIVCGNITSDQLQTESQLRAYEWRTTVYSWDESKPEQTYTLNYNNLAGQESMFKINNATFSLVLLNVREREFKLECLRMGTHSGSSQPETTVLVKYHVTVKEAKLTAKASPCGGYVLIFDQPWCLTVTFKGNKINEVQFSKSDATEYVYGSDGQESGPRASTASGRLTTSTVMVTFDSLKRDDMSKWTCKVDNGFNIKSVVVDLTTETVLDSENSPQAIVRTDYDSPVAVTVYRQIQRAVFVNQPWKVMFTLGGADFTNIVASWNGSVVYSSTSGGEESGSRADATSVAYNSSTRVVTVAFDEFKEFDTERWSFDFGLDKPVELDLRFLPVLYGKVTVRPQLRQFGEEWFLHCSFPDITDFGPLYEVHVIRYTKFLFKIYHQFQLKEFILHHLGATRQGETKSRRGELEQLTNNSAIFRFEKLIMDEDQTIWSCLVSKKIENRTFPNNEIRYGMDNVDLSEVEDSLYEMCSPIIRHVGVWYYKKLRITDASPPIRTFVCPEEYQQRCLYCKANTDGTVLYLEADLERVAPIMRVGLIKYEGSSNRKTKYKLSFSRDGVHYTEDDNFGRQYGGYMEQTSNLWVTLPKPVLARYVRVIFTYHFGRSCVRLELQVCDGGVWDEQLGHLTGYTPEPPLRFTEEPPTQEPLVRSPSCGGGSFQRPPAESKRLPLCRKSCEVQYNSCIDICNSWFRPHDRRECEMRCNGEACACGRQCMFTRPNHRQRPDGRPRLSSVGMGIRRPGVMGDLDAGMGGVGGTGSMRGTDIRHVADIDTVIRHRYNPQRK